MTEARASVRLTRYLAAPARDVWAALTEPTSLVRWLGEPVAAELEAGGPFAMRLGDGGRTVAGRVVSVDPGRVLELDWSAPGEEPSVVRFELDDDDEQGTKLVLEHRRLDERICMAYMAGWERALDRLERCLAVVGARP